MEQAVAYVVSERMQTSGADQKIDTPYIHRGTLHVKIDPDMRSELSDRLRFCKVNGTLQSIDGRINHSFRNFDPQDAVFLKDVVVTIYSTVSRYMFDFQIVKNIFDAVDEKPKNKFRFYF